MSTGTYRAVVCDRLSKTAEEGINGLRVADVQRTELAAGQIRVRVHAACLNFPDLLMLQGKYQHKPELPFTLCSEGAGVVTEVHANTNCAFKPGDKVMFLGLHGAGAEEWVGPATAAAPMPHGLTYPEASGFLMGYQTGYHALVHRGHIKPGEWLLVTGAGGGMGIAAVQLGKALGAKVIAAASSDEKLALCKQAGADAVINYSHTELKPAVKKITKGRFCDVIYDPVGGDIFDQCVRCVAPKGGARLLVIGFASGRIPKLPINLALIKGFDLVGVRMGAELALKPHLRTDMMQALNELASKGLLRPVVSATYPIENCKEAFTQMAERKILAKQCIVMNEGAQRSKL